MRDNICVLGRLALVAALSAGACNKTFPTMIPVEGAGGFVESGGGSRGGTGAGGEARGSGTLSDGGSLPAHDGGSAAVEAGFLERCATVVPTGPVIADFDGLDNRAFGVVGVDPVIGVAYVLSPELHEDFSGANWHLTGMVSGPASFGLSWICPAVADGACTLDLSRYAGIQFAVSGNIGPESTLQLILGSVPDEPLEPPLGCGVCDPLGGTVVCSAPFASVNLQSVVGPQTVSLTWNVTHSGSPFQGTDPYWVTSIVWALPAPTDGGSYPVDFTLDDVRLIPIPH